MIAREPHRTLSLSQLFLILMGTLLLYLIVNFGRQVAVSYERREELRRVEDQVAAARAETEHLRQYLDYANSDASAEAWARAQGWARPGEVPVIIVAPESTLPAVPEDAPAPGSPASHRQAWWELFFGAR